MHAAPAVSVCCSGGQPWRCACALLQALAFAAASAWALQHLERHPAWAVIPGLAVAGLSWWWMRPRQVQLAFDGQGWTADGQPGHPELMVDFGRLLLLRWWQTGARRAVWLPCTAGAAGPAWHALRVAAHAQRAPELQPGVQARPARD